MKRPAVFFDRDNTLIVSDGYLGDPTQVVLVEGAPEAVAKARQYGFKVVTFSNQSGVGRGMFDEEAVQAVNRRMDELLQAANPAAVIERHEYCPFHPEAPVEKYRQDSDRRKPKPGMLLEAATKMSLDLARSWVVGDAPRDIEAGKAAGCRTILFKHPTMAASPAAEAASSVTPDYTVASLKEAVDIIAKEAFARTVKVEEKPVSAAPVVIEEDVPPAVAEEKPVVKDRSVMSKAPMIAAAAKVEKTEAKRPETAAPEAKTPAEQPMQRVEQLLTQMLAEMRRQREGHAGDFSVSKLLGGIVQAVTVALLIFAYINRAEMGYVTYLLLFAIALQTLTIALLIMGRQR